MSLKNEIQFEFDNMLAENLSDKQYGISKTDIENISVKARDVFERVIQNAYPEEKAYFDMVRKPKDLDEIEKFADEVAEKFENFVVLGVGGSALGTRVLIEGLRPLNYNNKKEVRKGRPRIFIRDNIDPVTIAGMFEIVDCKSTMFCIVTKSGSTLETIIQMSLVQGELKQKLGENYFDHICVITANQNNPLNKWCKENKVKTFYFSQDLSGRFSVLSAVGLLPASVAGIDIGKILDGASNMFQRCSVADFENNPALFGAVLQKLTMDKGLNISFLMPYADNLKVFADWYCQLWSESLGKRLVNNGSAQHIGQTPVRLLGTVDQHSQLQLCLEGPFDKVVTFIRVLRFEKDMIIPDTKDALLADYVCGKKVSDILISSQKATQQALLEQSRVNRTIVVPETNEFSIGELFMFFMLETSFTGGLLGVNTYNQPSVELIKQNVKKLLSKDIDSI